MTQPSLLGDDDPTDMVRTADLSDDGIYRYRLTRTWGSPASPAVFVMLNPSTADAEQDDPTVRRCIGFAKAWGHGSLIVVNLYALRSTDPRALWNHAAPVGGRVNDTHIAGALRQAGLVVAAWGAHARPHRVEAFREIAAETRTRVMHLGLTMRGAPRHPLYLPAVSRLHVWFDPAEVA